MFHIIHAAKVSQYSSISNYIAQFRPPKSKLCFFHSSINFFTGVFLQCLYLIVAFSPWHNRMTLDYFYGQARELFSFFRIPKALFQEQRFQSLSTDARTLYGILLDRMSLSVKNGWLDEQGRVYIILRLSGKRFEPSIRKKRKILIPTWVYSCCVRHEENRSENCRIVFP